MADDGSATPASRLNPGAVSVTDLARLLTRLYGERVTEDMIRADIAAGAPTNADGTINIVRYAAWLLRALSHGA